MLGFWSTGFNLLFVCSSAESVLSRLQSGCHVLIFKTITVLEKSDTQTDLIIKQHITKVLVEDCAETSLRTKCTSVECGALKLDLGGGGFSWCVATFCYQATSPTSLLQTPQPVVLGFFSGVICSLSGPSGRTEC